MSDSEDERRWLCRTKSASNVSCGLQNVTCWVSNAFHLCGNVIYRVQNVSSGLTIMMTSRRKGKRFMCCS